MRRLIQSYADTQAEFRPAARAIVLGDACLTYEDLFRWSNSLARALQSYGCRRGDRVGLLVSKSPLAIAGILGVLKADCIYVPIDIDSPASRAAMILDNSEPRLLLVDASGAKILQDLRSHFPKTRAFQAASIEASNAPSDRKPYPFCAEDIVSFSNLPLRYQNEVNDPAYILYTSGSTGVPKGVPISHASVMHFINWAASYFKFTSEDRISGHPPFHFDLSVFDIFGAFASGAELHLIPATLNLSAKSMAELIRNSELTQWFSVPSVLSYLMKFDAIRHRDFPKLKRVLWCGEVLPTPILRYWMERLPAVQFTNLYGPTETTIASSFFTVPSIPEPNQSIPIGRPCEGEVLRVLDENLRPTPQGTIGELYIGGVGLSSGYWKDEQRTGTVFVESPDGSGRLYKTGDLARIGPDGLVYFAGRADGQIKSRGYRIELGEIEAALSRIEDLKESAVVAIPTSEFEGSLICCAFAPVEGARLTTIALREALRTMLPQYMLPVLWLSMDGLPRNANGKIARPLLKELFQQSAATTRQRERPRVQSSEV